jgi:hypothetical protein
MGFMAPKRGPPAAVGFVGRFLKVQLGRELADGLAFSLGGTAEIRGFPKFFSVVHRALQVEARVDCASDT